MAAKLTFKKNIATGRYRPFETESCEIKRNKRVVGNISEVSHFSKAPESERFEIQLMVIDESIRCGWKNITLKKKFSNMVDARQFVTDNAEAIQKQFNLREVEE